MSSREVLSDLAPRLRAAAATVADATEQLRLARQHRDELVVQAVEEGMTQKRVAEAAGVSAPHVTRILLSAEPDAVLPRA